MTSRRNNNALSILFLLFLICPCTAFSSTLRITFEWDHHVTLTRNGRIQLFINLYDDSDLQKRISHTTFWNYGNYAKAHEHTRDYEEGRHTHEFRVNKPGIYYCGAYFDLDDNWHCDYGEPVGLVEVNVKDNETIEARMRIESCFSWDAGDRGLEKPPRLYAGGDFAEMKFDLPRSSKALIEYGTDPDFKDVKTFMLESRVHQAALLTELSQGKTWHYRIYRDLLENEKISEGMPSGKGMVLFRKGSFKTSFRGSRSFRFAILGDSAMNPVVQGHLAKHMKKQSPDFILHLGDMVSDGEPKMIPPQEIQYTGFYRLLEPAISRCSLFPVRGNHDSFPGPYLFYHCLPGGKPYYTIKWGPLGIVVADGWDIYTTGGKDQLEWLERELARVRKEVKWLILANHYPLFFENGVSDVPELKDLAIRRHVDCVMAGHYHCFHRRYHPREKILQIVSGGAGSELITERNALQLGRDTIIRHHYILATVNRDGIRFEAFDLEGNAFDEFTLPRKP